MANEEHLRILRGGVERWNQWRKAHPDDIPDFRGADLISIHIMKADLSSADLKKANLSNTKLNNSDLTGADLSDADLSYADFSNADLSSANLSNAIFNNANFKGARLSGVKFIGTDLSNATFSSANLSNISLRNADFRNTDLSYADLSRSDLSGANLGFASLIGASLIGANLTDANLGDADFSYADLSNANLRNVHVLDTIFGNANLTGANLGNVKLNEALNLNSADLSYANLNGANLSDTNLTFAKLGNTNLSNANLSNIRLNGADLRNANLSNADLYAIQALGCNFSGATLTGACIENWQIDELTKLNGITCDYVFRQRNEEGNFTQRFRSDPQSILAPGDFEQWATARSTALNTIDLLFPNGIDWQAFFQSFQELRCQNSGQYLSIQSIERTEKGFVVRLEAAPEIDGGSLEAGFYGFYKERVIALEIQYEERLRLQGVHLEDLRQTIEAQRQQMTSMMEIAKVMADKQGDTFHTTVTGIVGAIGGANHGAMTANIGANADEISRLIQSLRQQAQKLPVPQQKEATDHLNDLEEYLQPPPEKRAPHRIKATLVALLAIAVGIGGAIATATDFTNNVLELSNKLGIEVVLPQATQQPSTIDAEVIELSPDGGEAP